MLKIKATDLSSGGDSLPVWRAMLLCGLSVSGAVRACVHTSLYGIICACLTVSIYVAGVNLGSSCKPVRHVSGSLEMEVGLEDFHLACFGKGRGDMAGLWERTNGYVWVGLLPCN